MSVFGTAPALAGGAADFKATKPKAGNKLDPDSSAVKAWRAHLTGKHDAAMAKVGATKIYDYTITNNGVAANLTKAQATALAKTPGIVGLERDQASHPTPRSLRSSSASAPRAACGRRQAVRPTPAQASSSASSTAASGPRIPPSPTRRSIHGRRTGMARASPVRTSQCRCAATSWSARGTTSRDRGAGGAEVVG
ncbi:protease inhibitor I9 family protein [Micromonospora coerulea]|uniref:protease inhibitor I9 family protein n=1 Tax=Micromonospora coerulea TaxID=47856 RepID=UPI003D15B713